MDNENNWNWGNGDERQVSSVYKDEDETNAFILVNPPKDIESQTTTAQTAKQSQEAVPQVLQPQTVELQNIKGTTQSLEPLQETASQTTEPQIIEQPQSSEPKTLQPRNIESKPVQPIESQPTPVQDSARQSEMHSNSQNNPQNNIPQPEFHPIVLPQNAYQQQNHNNQHTDYSARFGQNDISENKVSAIAAYLLGPIGIIIALLIARDSAYTAFHVRQALKMTICSVILEVFAAIFALFGLIPLVGIIFKMMLLLTFATWMGVLILRLIAIAQVSNGEAKEPPIIRNFAFLK